METLPVHQETYFWYSRCTSYSEASWTGVNWLGSACPYGWVRVVAEHSIFSGHCMYSTW